MTDEINTLETIKKAIPPMMAVIAEHKTKIQVEHSSLSPSLQKDLEKPYDELMGQINAVNNKLKRLKRKIIHYQILR